jgi:hypothetical protein
VLEAFLREFRSGVPWELIYADERAVMADSLDECVSKLEAWKERMETKGLRVNMKKTKLTKIHEIRLNGDNCKISHLLSTPVAGMIAAEDK